MFIDLSVIGYKIVPLNNIREYYSCNISKLLQVSFQITRIGGNAANNTLVLQQVIASMVDVKVEAELFSPIPDDGDLLKLRNFF